MYLKLVLLLLVTVAINAELPTWISYLQDGIQVNVDDSAVVTMGHWTLLITMSEPTMPDVFFNFTARLRTKVDSMVTIGLWQHEWRQRIRLLWLKSRNPHHWWQSSHRYKVDEPGRTRRGLFNFIGDVSSFLFGTATEDEIRDIHSTLKQLGTNQQRLHHDLERFTTIVNYNHEQIEKTRNALLYLQKQFINFVDVTDRRLNMLFEHVNRLTIRHDIDNILLHLENLVHDFLADHDNWLERKANLEAGQLTENILPPRVLHQILNTMAPPLTAPVSPLQWYYENIRVKPVWTDTSLVYKVTVPIVSSVKWRLYRFTVWPMPFQNSFVAMNLPSSVLFDTTTNRIVLDPICVGTPAVCTRHVVQDAILYPCVYGLLQVNPSYDMSCRLTIAQTVALANSVLVQTPFLTVPGEHSLRLTNTVYHVASNQYVLITSDVELTLRCQGQSTEVISVDAGVYVITVNYPCTVWTPKWFVDSEFIRTYNVSLTETFEINLPTESYLTPLLNVSGPTLDMLFPELEHIEHMEFSLQDLVAVDYPVMGFDWRWYLVCLVFLVPLIALIVCIRRRYRCPMPSHRNVNPELDLEMTTRSPRSPAPSHHSMASDY